MELNLNLSNKKKNVIISSSEGKDLYCTFLEKNVGKSLSLGYVYFDKDGNKLETPYMLSEKDFKEIDEVRHQYIPKKDNQNKRR